MEKKVIKSRSFFSFSISRLHQPNEKKAQYCKSQFCIFALMQRKILCCIHLDSFQSRRKFSTLFFLYHFCFRPFAYSNSFTRSAEIFRFSLAPNAKYTIVLYRPAHEAKKKPAERIRQAKKVEERQNSSGKKEIIVKTRSRDRSVFAGGGAKKMWGTKTNKCLCYVRCNWNCLR